MGKSVRILSSTVAVLTALVALAVIPPTTVSAEQRVLTPEEMDVEFIRLFNENKLDKLGEFYYAENALLMSPNHEPIRGRKAIVEELKGVRQAFGEFSGLRLMQVVESEGLTSIVASFATLHGGARIVTHEAFQRQVDGSWKVIADMVGFRDPQR